MNRLFKSTGVRLTLLAAGVFIAGMLAINLLVYFNVRDDMEDQLRDQVSAETRQLLGDYRDDGIDELRHDISERLERNPGARLQYTLQNPAGVTLFDRFATGSEPGWSRVRRDGAGDLILLTTPLEDGYWLGIAADTRSIRETTAALRHTMLFVTLPIILLGIISGALVSRRFLRRVERLKRTADQVGQGELSARMQTTGSGDEFDGLAITINRMLDRIEGLVHDMRHVSTNIAHDMRTPLGRLRQRLEDIARQQLDHGTRTRIEEAIVLLDETLGTFASLLRIAELDSGQAALQYKPVALEKLLSEIVTAYEPAATECHQHLKLKDTKPATIPGDRQLLAQLISNLIENAMTHNGAGTHIELSCGSENGQPVMVVRDDGTGIPPNEWENVLKPFHRLDKSRTSRGSGLGLSLAASIAARHEASLALSDSRPGLTVTVRFPAETS
ncbi:HAMP domain-containing sensor histidine kinase [Henriciella sp.]|uniref:sensor histidine kinase n=1 Tax=Henriciella sp. TaxID=1968823 RepID=UPI00260C2E55|nr:HAMP domain-containing sensor histidine kinase [Henriciella sp.]